MKGTWEAGDRSPLFEDLEAEEAEPKTVGFSAALDRILAGGAARREIWGDAAGQVRVVSLSSGDPQKVAVDPFFAYVAGDRAMVWTPSTVDLLAEDWLPVDR